ncbi:MAG: hypothetical protein ACFBRM_02360 [Pikeienuella sp.]
MQVSLANLGVSHHYAPGHGPALWEELLHSLATLDASSIVLLGPIVIVGMALFSFSEGRVR